MFLVPHSVDGQNKNYNRFGWVQHWINDHPVTKKIVIISGMILGIGVLGSLPFTASLGMSILVGRLIVGGSAIAFSIIFSMSLSVVGKSSSVPSTVVTQPATATVPTATAPVRGGDFSGFEEENEDIATTAQPASSTVVASTPAAIAPVSAPIAAGVTIAASLATAISWRLQDSQTTGVKLSKKDEDSLTLEEKKDASAVAPGGAAGLSSVADETRQINALWSSLEGKKLSPPQIYLTNQSEVFQRFLNIPCVRETAILAYVSSTAGAAGVVSLNHYLHANKVGEGITSRGFVACQAPLPVENEPFWRALYMVRGEVVIFDLTNANDLFVEDRSRRPITCYPENQSLKTQTYGSMSVKLTSTNSLMATAPDGSQSELLHVSHYQVTCPELPGRSKEILRYHFAAWPDQGVVTPEILHCLVQSLVATSPKEAWVHCRAGMGRTGTLMIAYILREQILNRTITRDRFGGQLVELISIARKQRGSEFVQNEEQFQLLYDYGVGLLNGTFH